MPDELLSIFFLTVGGVFATYFAFGKAQAALPKKWTRQSDKTLELLGAPCLHRLV